MDFQHKPLSEEEAKVRAFDIAIQWLGTSHIDSHSHWFSNYAYEDKEKIKDELYAIKKALVAQRKELKG